MVKLTVSAFLILTSFSPKVEVFKTTQNKTSVFKYSFTYTR